jgi:hypothetical protein
MNGVHESTCASGLGLASPGAGGPESGPHPPAGVPPSRPAGAGTSQTVVKKQDRFMSQFFLELYPDREKSIFLFFYFL